MLKVFGGHKDIILDLAVRKIRLLGWARGEV
jgi:hypothetical protein